MWTMSLKKTSYKVLQCKFQSPILVIHAIPCILSSVVYNVHFWSHIDIHFTCVLYIRTNILKSGNILNLGDMCVHNTRGKMLNSEKYYSSSGVQSIKKVQICTQNGETSGKWVLMVTQK